ncbi:MAG: SAM-dependent methyltransferase [Deltaproteobacteria bacterium]|jgi:SAM-dependent MidA family methyltransferase|nr:MAG: SAM-dependent methyltransferase [Deltaproteobacteria bacterium]
MVTEPENKELKSIIIDKIRKKGRITFAEYMDMALYHPVHGYYNSSGEKIGKDGDYYTSPHVHPVFGQLIARLLYQMWNIMGEISDFTIVEAGAGKGFLCCDILDYARRQLPDFYESLTYNIIEISSHFSATQKELMKSHSDKNKVIWYSPDDFGKRDFCFNGCYLSNELLDSFPFNMVKMEEGRLKEVYVTLNKSGFMEELGELSTPALEQYFTNLDITLEEGQKAEVNLGIFDWLKEIHSAMGKGFVITIDYGYTADELFAPYRTDGTISCYYRHTVNHNPYIRPGFQDITAHVDFTTLIETGEKMNLKKTLYLEQYRFLIALGLLDTIDDLEKNKHNLSILEYYKEKLAMKNFLMPGGMGVLFKVLIQQKGVEDKIKLKL